MNSHLNKEIFSETGCINKEMLLRYRDGKLRNSEKHEVEKHLVDCSLCTEAVEGLALVAGTASLDEVNQRLSHLTETTGTYTLTRYLAVAASLAAVITLTYFAYMQFSDVNVERLAASEVVSEDTVIQEQAIGVVEENPVAPVAEQNQEPLSNLPESITTQSAVAIVSERHSDMAAGMVAENEVVVAAPIASIESESAPVSDTLSDEAVTFSASGVPATTGYTSNITYVDNRKVIDYSNISKDKVETPAKAEKSTPSKYQNPQKKEEVENDALKSGIETKRKVEYLQILSGPIVLYNSGKYESAIIGFDDLLAINPGDENARFYKGMSLYHLKRYDAAISLLRPLSTINTQPFSEEALFYVAKSHAAKNENKQAISIFRSIVSGKGFYAEKAKEELKKLQ